MKYIFFKNTISPYRTSLFNRLYALGLDFEVDYMTEMEYGRSWDVDYKSMFYPYVVDKGIRRIIHGYEFLWNPKIIKQIISAKDSQIILCGSWNMPNIIAVCILKRLGIVKSKINFWSEANYLTIGSRKKNKLRDMLRAFVFNSGDGVIIVPGQMAIDTFKRWNITNKKFIHLPNVIEEELFEYNPDEYNLLDKNRRPRFVMSLRLIENLKGFINFFEAIGPENVKLADFIILGEGEDRKRFEQFIEKNNYQGEIHLYGFCHMDKMIREYKQADALILPSFSDPSPLSLVEGICLGLPILSSTHCGNHFETVKNGINGYTFNPNNHEEIKSTFERFVAERAKWSLYSVASRRLFEENFKQSNVLPCFIQNLNSQVSV